MLVEQRARPGALRAVPAKDGVLLGRQLATPLFIRFLYRKMCGFHRNMPSLKETIDRRNAARGDLAIGRSPIVRRVNAARGGSG